MKSLYKILHTTCHTGWGGLEKRIFNESVWMEQNGHQVIIAAPGDTPLLLRAKAHGFRVYPIEFRRLTIQKDYQGLKRIFYNEKPWVINTHGNKDAKLALFAAAQAKVPLRILSRHISAHVKNSWYNRIIYKKLCHYIFTTADYTTDHLRNVFKIKDMRVFSMPSGIVLPDTLPDREAARQNLARELDLDPAARFVGFIGRVSEDKGVSSLLEGFHRVKAQMPGYRVIIVGEGTPEYLDFLKQLAGRLGIADAVRFMGFKDDVWPFYRALDCKVLPSKDKRGVPFEGVPQSLLEAMVCECPVIGSKSGGIPDIIEDEKTGRLFDPDDPGDLADKLLIILQNRDKTAAMVEAARQIVEKKYTIDAMGRNIIRIYRLHQVKLEKSTSTYT